MRIYDMSVTCVNVLSVRYDLLLSTVCAMDCGMYAIPRTKEYSVMMKLRINDNSVVRYVDAMDVVVTSIQYSRVDGVLWYA